MQLPGSCWFRNIGLQVLLWETVIAQRASSLRATETILFFALEFLWNDALQAESSGSVHLANVCVSVQEAIESGSFYGDDSPL